MESQQQKQAQTYEELHELPEEAFVQHFIDSFPFPSFREGQRHAVKQIAKRFYEGYQYVVLDAPTGAGKSAINSAFAIGYNTSYYTTPQNSLIDQIEEDDFLKDHYKALKGKSNYKCNHTECYKGENRQTHRADRCEYNEEGLGNIDGTICCDSGVVHSAFRADTAVTPDRLKEIIDRDQGGRICEYPKAVFEARTSENLLTNTFLYSIAPFLDTRDITVIDEAHNLESVFFNFCDIGINSNNVPFYDEIEEDIPKEDSEELKEWITSDLKREVKLKIEDDGWVANAPDKDVDKVERLAKKIRIVDDLDEDFLLEDYEDNDQVDGVKLKPIYCGDFFQKFVKRRSRRFLFSSATFQNAETTLSKLGIPEDQIAVVKIPSGFPVENRPIYYRDVTDLRNKNYSKGDYKKIAREIDDIASKYPDEKGIVHCVSYGRMRKIKNYLSRFDCFDRIMSHESRNSDRKMERFQNRDDNTILLSVGKEEGIDLEEELGRFNIITKIPNANMGDERIRYRVLEHNEWNWYNALTAMRLAQSYGRTTRSSEDWSDTYILDENFEDYYSRNKRLLPKWFREAVEDNNPRLA